MNSLPLYLLDEILFRLHPKYVAMMRCTSRSIKSHISNFEAEYFSRIGSSLIHISRHASNLLCFHPAGNSKPITNKECLERVSEILGSCSGLLLLYVYGLCVANPLTKKFRFLRQPRLKRLTSIGFAVDQLDRTTQRFKVVNMNESILSCETRYIFEINAGDSWRLSQTNLTCSSSNLKKGQNTVSFEGSIHWLREDGSIVAFNPETEQARLIPIKFPQEPAGSKVLLGASDNRLTLISATVEVISVFTLEKGPKWILVKRIKNDAVQRRVLLDWEVQAYDGKCLLVWMMKSRDDEQVVRGYDLRANKWGVVCSIPSWCDAYRYFYQFKPSWSCVIGLLDHQEEKHYGIDSGRISSVKGIMELINRNLRN